VYTTDNCCGEKCKNPPHLPSKLVFWSRCLVFYWYILVILLIFKSLEVILFIQARRKEKNKLLDTVILYDKLEPAGYMNITQAIITALP